MTDDEGPTLRDDLKWGAAVMLVVVLAVSSFTAALWSAPPQGQEHLTSYVDADGNTRSGITDAIFEDYLVAFEILGVLLLAALVGAIVIAVREEDL